MYHEKTVNVKFSIEKWQLDVVIEKKIIFIWTKNVKEKNQYFSFTSKKLPSDSKDQCYERILDIKYRFLPRTIKYTGLVNDE